MKRKSLVILQQAIRAVCPLVLLAHPVSAAPQQKPNILIMLADDLGYADL